MSVPNDPTTKQADNLIQVRFPALRILVSLVEFALLLGFAFYVHWAFTSRIATLRERVYALETEVKSLKTLVRTLHRLDHEEK